MTTDARRRATWLLLALALFAASLALHLPVTDLCDMLARRYGFARYDAVVRGMFAAAGVMVLAWIWIRPGAHGRLVRLGLIVFAALAAVIARWLLVTSAENVHYPQYFAITYCLAQAGVAWERSFIGGSLLGVVDETIQLRWLPRGTPPYLDWTDIVLDAVGAALAVVVAARVRPRPHASLLLQSRVVLGVSAIAVIPTLLYAGWPRGLFVQLTPGGRPFHTLSTLEGIVAWLVLWIAVRQIVRGASRAVDRSVRT